MSAPVNNSTAQPKAPPAGKPQSSQNPKSSGTSHEPFNLNNKGESQSYGNDPTGINELVSKLWAMNDGVTESIFGTSTGKLWKAVNSEEVCKAFKGELNAVKNKGLEHAVNLGKAAYAVGSAVGSAASAVGYAASAVGSAPSAVGSAAYAVGSGVGSAASAAVGTAATAAQFVAASAAYGVRKAFYSGAPNSTGSSPDDNPPPNGPTNGTLSKS